MRCRWLFGGRLSSSVVCWTVWCRLRHHWSSRTNTTTPSISQCPLELASSSWRRTMWAPNNATPWITRSNRSHSEGVWPTVLPPRFLGQKEQQLGDRHFEDRSQRLEELPLLSTDFYVWLKLSVSISSIGFFFLFYICLKVVQLLPPSC